MKPKKYSEVNYIAIKQRKQLWISLLIANLLILLIITALCIKFIVSTVELLEENRVLKQQNNELVEVVESLSIPYDVLKEDR